MNVSLLPKNKIAELPQNLGMVHASVLSATPDEKAIIGLLEVAENEEQKRRIVRNVGIVITWFCCAFALAGVLCLFISRFVGRPTWLEYTAVMAILWSGPVYLFNGFIGKRSPPKKGLQMAVAALLQCPDDPRFLLPFIDGLNTEQTPNEKSQAYPLLTDRLWNLSATDAALSLDDTRRAALRDTISHVYAIMPSGRRMVKKPGTFDNVTTDLAVAIMKTLAGIGDKKTVEVLEKIINAGAVTPNERVVRDAAREYLTVLWQKIADNEWVQKQLRVCFEDKTRDPHKAVEEFVETLAPEPAKAVLVEFLRVQTYRDKVLGTTLYTGALGVAVCTSLLLLTVLKHHAGFAGGVGASFAIIINVMYSQARNCKSNPCAQKVASELSRRSGNDTRLLPLLLHAARSGGDAKQADTIKKALVRLLPLLQPGDAPLVPPAQRSYLRSWLKVPRNKKKAVSGSQTLTIAALDALVALGDTKALPAAEKIARRTLRGTYREAELHEAALRCVHALRARKG